jgi:hypothetical protein
MFESVCILRDPSFVGMTKYNLRKAEQITKYQLYYSTAVVLYAC